ncbi:MAG: deoxynucleoside kinase [Oscillospiraceae bacterium]
MKCKLIVIEGLDGSGKSTQGELVANELSAKLISFPDYNSRSCELVKMYLSGEMSQNLNDINAYAASSFYAVDRYASYKMHWQNDYQEGKMIIATRYVTSNAIHQMVKLDCSLWENYLDWLYDFEYNKLGLPIPDKIIFLNMDRDIANRLILQRDREMDIHEKNTEYLKKCELTAKYCCEKFGWSIVNCFDDGLPLDKNIIKNKIISLI